MGNVNGKIIKDKFRNLNGINTHKSSAIEISESDEDSNMELLSMRSSMLASPKKHKSSNSIADDPSPRVMKHAKKKKKMKRRQSRRSRNKKRQRSVT